MNYKSLKITLIFFFISYCLFGQEAYAQLSIGQEARVKDVASRFCKMMERLATNPRDDEAFGKLVDELFQDAGSGLVYDDFLDGEVSIPFIQYLSKVKDFQGQLSFTYSGFEHYYHYSLGLELGVVAVKKQVKGSRLQFEVMNVLIIDANTGRVREIGKHVLRGAQKFGSQIQTESKISNNNTASSARNYSVKVKDVDFHMIYVEGGAFSMGCTNEQGSNCSSDEKPVHKVTVSDFFLSQTEVTQKQWRMVMGYPRTYFKPCDECPVEAVSWEEAVEYCKKLSSLTGQSWRLPTEAEWEYAARGGPKSQNNKYAGSNSIDIIGWYEGNTRKKPQVVAQKMPNELGLFDMSGNVYEWCSDWFGLYSSDIQTNPQGPLYGVERVLRGGSFIDSGALRVSDRYRNKPNSQFSNVGFRVLRVP